MIPVAICLACLLIGYFLGTLAAAAKSGGPDDKFIDGSIVGIKYNREP
jgi:hypothetical protein